MSKPPAPQLVAPRLFGEPEQTGAKALRLLECLDEMMREIDLAKAPEDRTLDEATVWATVLRGTAGQDHSESWKIFWRRWVGWYSVPQNRAAYERVTELMLRVAKIVSQPKG